MRRSVLSSISIGLGCAAAFTCASPAQARLAVGTDLNLAVAARAPAGDLGNGMNGRLGFSVTVGPFTLVPELGAGYTRFDDDYNPTRVFAGGRLALGGLVRPSIFAHYGHAWVSRGAMGPTYDIGAGIDLGPPAISIGAHAGYVSVEPATRGRPLSYGEPTDWVHVGLHAGIGF